MRRPVLGRILSLLNHGLANLLLGAGLLLLLPVGRWLRHGPAQLGLWLVLGLLSLPASEYFWVDKPVVPVDDGIPVLLGRLALIVGPALIIGRWGGQPGLWRWLLVASSIVLVWLQGALVLFWYLRMRGAELPWFGIYIALNTWCFVALALALARRLHGAGTWRWPASLVLCALFGIYHTRYIPSFWQTDPAVYEQKDALASPPADEALIYRQHQLLQQQLSGLQPQRPGIVDLYFIGVAGDAGEPVFQREVQHVEQLMKKRFDTAGRSVLLINHAETQHRIPLASGHSLAATLKRVGELADPREDIVLLYLSSHGSSHHEFLIDYQPLPLAPLKPRPLQHLLQQAGIGYRAVIVSACYAGGFLAPLRHDAALVMTAADADSTSFGCGADTHYTWFGEALFADALTQTRSLEQAFSRTRRLIEGWEKRDGVAPSNPQLFVGGGFARQWRQLEHRLQAMDPH